MPFRFPVRRFLQGTDKTETPTNRFGTLQWVLTRPMYRFHTFDLTQVPAKNRSQALSLELAQWTPFANSDYYVGWLGQQALVWGWDTDKIKLALTAQGLKPQRVRILPETVLQTPFQDGLCLSRCHEGYEGQLWRKSHLEHSRWWPQSPTPQEWLMFQRDAGIPPNEQQNQLPAPRVSPLTATPWVNQQGSADNKAIQLERIIFALGAVLLLAPTFWYAFSLYKVQQSTAQLQDQQAQLKREVEPITKARSQALDYLARINMLRTVAPYPEQLSLMATITQVLPQDKSYLKDWDFQSGQLKITVTSPSDISTTNLIGLLQQAGSFRDVKALPGRDPKNVTFQMDVIGR
jgi:Tfp pilus assembly protein PilN